MHGVRGVDRGPLASVLGLLDMLEVKVGELRGGRTLVLANRRLNSLVL